MSGRAARMWTAWRWRIAIVASVALAASLAGSITPAHADTSLYVDQKNSSCTNTGSGTATRPFCTISKAAAVATAGQTVTVNSGTYNEQVMPANSGTSSAPITYQPAPGATVTVGGQIHAFTISKAWIVVKGFTVSGTTGYGIYLKGGASNVTVSGNRVTASGLPANGSSAQGIYVRDTTNSKLIGNVTDHNSDTGIYLTAGASNVEVRGNSSFANARQYTRAATGIDVRNPGNTVIGNVVHDNEDSGIQLYNGATGTVVANNLSYNNGDHGIDVLNSANAIVVGNTVYGSVTSGINLEGSSGTSASSGATVANNISVDNALKSTTTKGNIRVDVNSQAGTKLDYDLLYLSGSGVMGTWGGKTYTTLGAFSSASGQETHGLQAQPRWAAAAQGDFHLTAGSPAIDSATSLVSGAQLSDLDGEPRVDDPATPNIGVGPRTYDDRGALEYQTDQPPAAVLSVSPATGTAPVTVTADASASTGTDSSPIASYNFDWGDGTTTGEQADPIATHQYGSAGTFTITVTVTDTRGESSTATRSVQVSSSDNPPVAALSITPQSGTAPLAVTADASDSTDADSTPIATYAFDFGDGTSTGPQSAATADHTYLGTGVYTVTVTVTDTAGLTETASAKVTVGTPDSPPAASLAVSPTSGTAPLTVDADASGSTDEDSTPIATYKFNFGDGATVGPQAAPTASHQYTTAGTFTVTVTVTDTAGQASTATAVVKVTTANQPPNPALTVTPTSGPAPLQVSADASDSTDTDGLPIASYRFNFGDGVIVGPQAAATATHTYSAAGSYQVTVTVTDSGGLSASTARTVTVSTAAGTNLIGNPGFETDTAGWNANGRAGITVTRVSGAHSGSWAAQLTNTASTTQADCTLNDSPNWIKTTQAGTYTAGLWVRADTAGAVLKLRMREYNGSTFVSSATAQLTLTTSWQQVKVGYAPQVVGSTLDYTAYITNAVPGACFTADDASITVG